MSQTFETVSRSTLSFVASLAITVLLVAASAPVVHLA
jgi:hypothetical protein